MYTSLLILALGVAQPQADAVDLARVFKQGEKATYEFSSRIFADVRELSMDEAGRLVMLETFMPETAGFSYTFTIDVEALKPGGVADIRFKRPRIMFHQGETFNAPPKDEPIELNQNVVYTMSHRNQLLSYVDYTPKPPPKTDPPPSALKLMMPAGAAQIDIGGWMGQMRSLSAFVNFFDMGPILPNRSVEIGDTWQETVGYAPVTIKQGADAGRNINRRVDFTLTFMGRTELDGRNYWHIRGKIDQDTDAAPFIAEMMGVELDRSPLKEVKLKMDGTVDYYLDIATLAPVRITATSTGEIEVNVRQIDTGPVYEEKFRSRASLVRK